MPEQIIALSSQRAYEFHPNDLRLSMLSTKPLQDSIQELFHFQSSTIGAPIATFGPIPSVYPPGIVFNMGICQVSGNQLVPIRFLHFEQLRIVIDVAGYSSAIDVIFAQLVSALSQVQAPDGSPLIGMPEKTYDYSEISALFSFPLDAIFVPSVRNLMRQFVNKSYRGNVVPVPGLVLQSQLSTEKYAGLVSAGDHHSFTLALRAGSYPDENRYFSAAPLDFEKHLNYLKELELAVAHD